VRSGHRVCGHRVTHEDPEGRGHARRDLVLTVEEHLQGIGLAGEHPQGVRRDDQQRDCTRSSVAVMSRKVRAAIFQMES